jgi:ABC-type uncharacterized transport system involved in gliding motility auxiliary subunit
MAIKNILNKKYVFLIIGIVLLFLGGSKAYIDMKFDVASVILSLVGLGLLIVFFVMNRYGIFRKCFYSDLRILILMGIINAGLIAGLVGVNVLGVRYDRQWDLTTSKQHTLTTQTVSILGVLTHDVKITVFYVGLSPQYLQDLLAQFEYHSTGKVKTEIIDPLVNLGYASQFGSTISGDERKAYIQSGSGLKEIDFSEDVLTEESLVNGILRATRGTRNVYFLAGHNEYDIKNEGETGLEKIVTVLEENNIKSHSLVLGLKGEIPQDCDVLVIAGPKEFLTDEETRLIQEYLRKGGDAFFLIEHSKVTTPDKPLTEEELKKNPALNNILNEWGIHILSDVVVDLSNHASGDVGSPATNNYSTHRAMVKDLNYTFYVRPRSITTIQSKHNQARTAPLVLTSSKDQSWGESNRMLQVKRDVGVDQLGPVPIAYVVWEPRFQEKISDTRIVVFTDADFMTNVFVDQYSNKQMALNVIQWLSELDYKVFAGSSKVKVERLDLSSSQKRMVSVILFLIPCLIVLGGLLVWMGRKEL